MEATLINVKVLDKRITKVPYKRVTSTWLSELFICCFIRNNQLKIILGPKGHILSCKFCSPLVVNFIKYADVIKMLVYKVVD